MPGDLKVTRNRVPPRGDCGSPTLSWSSAMRNPEVTLTTGGLSTACLDPSESKDTSAEGGKGFKGATPNVTVCGVTGSKSVHSTVSPTWTTVVPGKKRI